MVQMMTWTLPFLGYLLFFRGRKMLVSGRVVVVKVKVIVIDPSFFIGAIVRVVTGEMHFSWRLEKKTPIHLGGLLIRKPLHMLILDP